MAKVKAKLGGSKYGKTKRILKAMKNPRSVGKPPPVVEYLVEDGIMTDIPKPEDLANTPVDKKRRLECFIREYILDFNAVATCRRLGYADATAVNNAYRFLNEPYAQWYLMRMLRKLEDAAIIGRNDISAALWREANNNGIDGTHAARISALRTLAKIHNMDTPRTTDASQGVLGGVMKIPIAAALAEWENAAKASQAALKAKVRE